MKDGVVQRWTAKRRSALVSSIIRGETSAQDALLDIVAAVGERMTVMMDGGVRRGADVLIALALGARFVLLGRPTPLCTGGRRGGHAGVAKAISLLR